MVPWYVALACAFGGAVAGFFLAALACAAKQPGDPTLTYDSGFAAGHEQGTRDARV